MNKRSVSIALIIPVLILVMVMILPGTTFAQKKKQPQLAKEKIKMDALALSFARCKLNLLRYESAQKPDNKNLVKELDQFARIQNNLHMHLWVKYQKDKNGRDKFEKEIKNSQNKLSVCIKYQNIFNAMAKEQEKVRTDKKE